MVCCLIVILACSVSAVVSADSDSQLSGIKCIVSGKPASGKYSSRYKKGKIYFDCHHSKRRFEADRKSFESKANHQLVVTGQYLQARCPIKKVDISDASLVTSLLAGVTLRFCCRNCRDEFGSHRENRQKIELVFGARNFDRIFVAAPQNVTAQRILRNSR